MFGMPYMSRPPARSLFSTMRTRRPRRASSHAQARPAGPEPTTVTSGASSGAGVSGFGPPCSHCQSLMARSSSRMVVGSSCRPRLQAASHNAGHTLPVNSGSGFVSAMRSAAWSQRPRHSRSFHSGMRLCSGQPLVRALPKPTPVWQNATPQYMQRPACTRCSSAGSVTARSS